MSEDGFIDTTLTHFHLDGPIKTLYGAYEDKWERHGHIDTWKMANSYPLSTSNGYLLFRKKTPLLNIELELRGLLLNILDEGSERVAYDVAKQVADQINLEVCADLHLIGSDIRIELTDYPAQYQFLFHRDTLDQPDLDCEVAIIFGEENISKRYKLTEIGRKATTH